MHRSGLGQGRREGRELGRRSDPEKPPPPVRSASGDTRRPAVSNQRLPVKGWLDPERAAQAVLGAQHAALARDSAATSEPNVGIVASVRNDSQAMPCGSMVQYLSLRA